MDLPACLSDPTNLSEVPSVVELILSLPLAKYWIRLGVAADVNCLDEAEAGEGSDDRPDP